MGRKRSSDLVKGISSVDGQSYDGPCPLCDPGICLFGSGGARKGWEVENEPLFYGKELKAVELQLILYDFKVCILSEPDLARCERCLPGIWRRLRGGRDEASTAGSGGRRLDLRGPVRRRGEGAGSADGGEEETGDRVVEHWRRGGADDQRSLPPRSSLDPDPIPPVPAAALALPCLPCPRPDNDNVERL